VRELASEGLAHAQIVVDSIGVLIGANQVARRLLDIPTRDLGRPLKDLDVSFKPLDLRSPLDRVFRDRRPVSVPTVHFSADGAEKVFDLYVAPLVEDDGTVVGASISFFDVTQTVHLRAELDRARQEVETAYEELQSSNEELETTNEELQSTVEELETTNEELQSSNEELETMNEELESTNAELHSINNELRERTGDVERLNMLLLSITGHIEVGAAVLDDTMRVQVWNERAGDLWGLRSDEVIGKRFFDLDIGLPADQLRSMIRSVDAGAAPEEMEVTAVTRRGRTIRCRVMAYTLADGSRPAGVVLVMEELKPAARD
jgi:two-component system CheB/CheR fusion protein